MTEAKIRELKDLFPSIDDTFLLEILLSCDGSLNQAVLLLNESVAQDLEANTIDEKPAQTKRRKLKSSVYQSSLSLFMSPSQTAALPSKNPEPPNGNTKPDVQKAPGKTKTIHLCTEEAIETKLSPYISFHRNFLPPDLAERLLFFLNKNEAYSNRRFYLFGQKCMSNHDNVMFGSSNDGVTEKAEIIYNGRSVSNNIQPYNDDLSILQVLVEDFINREIEKQIEEHTLTPFQLLQWRGDICNVNRYQTKENNLDWHSDRLSYIGPHNFIASMSLGATRHFKIRRQYPVKQNPNPIYSIPLPHNTLLLMRPGCQEEFKHCIMGSKQPIDLYPDPKIGETRINVTMRYYRDDLVNYRPKCDCGINMVLRRSYKDVKLRGRYFWSCEAGYAKIEGGCKKFYWAKFHDNSKGEMEEDLMVFYTEKADECSIWVADEDSEKKQYLQETENNLGDTRTPFTLVYLYTTTMKFIDEFDIELVNQALTFDTSDASIKGGCDLFTTKSVGKDKKFYKSLEKHLDQMLQDNNTNEVLARSIADAGAGLSLSPPRLWEELQQRMRRRSSVAGPIYQRPVFKPTPHTKGRSYSTGKENGRENNGANGHANGKDSTPYVSPPKSFTNLDIETISEHRRSRRGSNQSNYDPFENFEFDPLNDPLSRKIYCYVIAILNALYPDHDFSELEPSTLSVVLLDEIIANINSILITNPNASNISTDAGLNPNNLSSLGSSKSWMWEIVNSHMDFEDCLCLKFGPDDQSFLVDDDLQSSASSPERAETPMTVNVQPQVDDLMEMDMEMDDAYGETPQDIAAESAIIDDLYDGLNILWSMFYFIYNKKRKRVAFVYINSRTS
ncbi:hypothetical protein BABINDRAFT_7074 [Babjeviella inositovora NRRL Y-12698]|uniref:CUE domain-containing protein n=1 Tax=Babjeviella inositovora NRRL Y-12698 TaxID=984486 RepID=A0A1E3QVZ7_9ASCO|nr:uncharacterized protein BABINDRAFT_7074 [Babjeviella inositovora NRRL Y-12698]ODQ81262.1 hypothetical protein BABINDRAFT_7074 [Babjeviella inositovora NRRL Y-12698]